MIIDGQSEFRRLLAHHVTARWPEARLSEYDPATAGPLPEEFSGAGNDLILLGDRYAGVDAETVLQRFGRTKGFPPVIFISDTMSGAKTADTHARLSRGNLGHRALIATIDTLLSPGRKPRRGAANGGEEVLSVSVKGYRLIRQLAEGAHATLYLATRDGSDHEMALKVLREFSAADGEEDAGVFERFLQEYEIIADLDHPNIVRIHDLGISDHQAFIAMEYLPGGDLRQRLAAGVTEAAALGFCRQIAGALANLHAVDILHRDLKPGNVMLRNDGSIALIDFGLAKRMRQGIQTVIGREIFGTPYYMSPEQGRGRPVDARSDLYSLGIVLHEMLTGVRPFRGRDPMQVIFNHAEAPLPILPDELHQHQQVLDKLLAKNPDDRFQSAEELLKWL